MLKLCAPTYPKRQQELHLLKPLEDFHLFELTPDSAGYVRGFAKAYKLSGSDLSEVKHLSEGGHGKSKMTA